MSNWIISCNPKFYNVEEALYNNKQIYWFMKNYKYAVNDTLYIYVSGYIESIKYKVKVIKVNIPSKKLSENDKSKHFINSNDYDDYYMLVECMDTYKDDVLNIEFLKKIGIKNFQSSSKIDEELVNEIEYKLENDLNSYKRNYYFVFQNKSFDEECENGYLWAPKATKERVSKSHWSLMKKVRKGDVIIHSYNQKIKAISVAKTDFYEDKRPNELPNDWTDNGWRVDTDYIVINNPINTKVHIDKIMEYQPNENAPFGKHKKGNTGYLFKSKEELLKYIVEQTLSIKGNEDISDKLLNLLEYEIPVQEIIEDNMLIEDINDDYINKSEEYNYDPKPIEKPLITIGKKKKVIKRNKKIAKNALIRADHKCEVDSNHPSFIRRNMNVNYAEPHHLIPLSNQDEFDYSLDVEANIICLCSNCHNQIHYGKDYEQLLSILWEKRHNELTQAGILIEKEKLLEYYN